MTLILLAEDDPSVQEVVARILGGRGYEVIPVADGRAALQALDQTSPDLILLDIYMPLLDGRRLIQEYRQRPGPHAPILVITGAGHAAHRAIALEAADSLDKPFGPKELLAKVEALIGPPTRGN